MYSTLLSPVQCIPTCTRIQYRYSHLILALVPYAYGIMIPVIQPHYYYYQDLSLSLSLYRTPGMPRAGTSWLSYIIYLTGRNYLIGIKKS